MILRSCRFLSTFNEIVEFSVALLFVWSLLSISCMLLATQAILVEYKIESFIKMTIHEITFHFRFSFKATDDWNGIILSRILMFAFGSFFVLFLACEFGEWLTGRFDKFNDAFVRCKWYLWSDEMRRIYLIALAGTQQTEYIRSYGNIPCTRDSFKKVGEDIFHWHSNELILRFPPSFFRLQSDSQNRLLLFHGPT